MHDSRGNEVGGQASSRERSPASLALLVATLGVVYGDIGTSPLYAIRECFFGAHPMETSEGNVLGVLSLVFWSVVVVVTLKYMVYVLRLDNRGEGGILALMSLLRPASGPGVRRTLLALGLFGAALLYGDGIITPAISVLSAVEGLEVLTPVLSPYVVPATVVILIALFALQRRGTAGVGSIFGPVMVLWFGSLAAFGVHGIAQAPRVLAAASPVHAVRFFAANGMHGYLVLGAVFLVLTGAEALYADLGHFGSGPIRINWFLLVAPALLLNYFGQGALLLAGVGDIHHPFYQLAPPWALVPLVVLATAATVIASQAVISGAFSLTRQAVHLGYLPRLGIVHTSEERVGQIYIPAVNWLMFVATVGLVLAFQRSTNLAAAYGVAVTTTMVVTTLLAFMAAREVLGWRMAPVLAVTGVFLAGDLAFFGANILKVSHGGWLPLAIAAVIFTAMSTWFTGRQILRSRMEEGLVPESLFVGELATSGLTRVRGTAVFMAGTARNMPPALMHNIKHNKVLHEKVVLLTVIGEEVPRVTGDARVEAQDIGCGIYRIIIRAGFMEGVDIPAELARLAVPGLAFPPMETTYFLGKETVLATGRRGMAPWREHLFAMMSRNARDATTYFRLPPNRVVELGSRIEL